MGVSWGGVGCGCVSVSVCVREIEGERVGENLVLTGQDQSCLVGL